MLLFGFEEFSDLVQTRVVVLRTYARTLASVVITASNMWFRDELMVIQCCLARVQLMTVRGERVQGVYHLGGYGDQNPHGVGGNGVNGAINPGKCPGRIPLCQVPCFHPILRGRSDVASCTVGE